MKQDDSPTENWDPCLHGVIQETAVQADLSRRRMVRLLGAGVILMLVAASASSMFFDQNGSNGMPSAIGCDQVKLHLVSYVKGEIQDKGMSRRMTFHLMKCKCCDVIYRDSLCKNDPNGCHNPGKRPYLKPSSENQTP